MLKEWEIWSRIVSTNSRSGYFEPSTHPSCLGKKQSKHSVASKLSQVTMQSVMWMRNKWMHLEHIVLSFGPVLPPLWQAHRALQKGYFLFPPGSPTFTAISSHVCATKSWMSILSLTKISLSFSSLSTLRLLNTTEHLITWRLSWLKGWFHVYSLSLSGTEW